MNKLIFAMVLILIATTTVTVMAGDDKAADQRSYYQYKPNKVQPAASLWNPIIHEKDGKVTGKSYFQYPDSKTLPQGSIWNPLLTVKEKCKK